jgi:hypothetical protein
MAIQTITNPNIIGLVENSILPLAKITVISVVLNTIQSLGVLANSLTVQTKILEDNRIWLSMETVKAFSYFFSSAEIGPSDEPFLVCISDSSGKCLLDRKNALQEFQEEVETSLPKIYEESLNSPVQDCFNPEDCFDINPSKIHQREWL